MSSLFSASEEDRVTRKMSRVGHPSPQMANQHKDKVHPLASSSNDDDINRLNQLARYSTAAIEMYERNRHLSSTTHKGHQVEQLLERRDDAVYHQRNHARSREIQNTRHPQWKVPTSAPPSHSRVGTQLAPSGYHSFHFGHHQYLPQSRFGHGGYPIGMQPGGGMVPLSSEEKRMLPHAATRFASSNRNDYHQSLAIKAMTANHLPVGSQSKPQCKDTRGECSASRTGRSRVLIPSNLVIPKEITASTCDTSVSPTDTLGDCSTGTGKRSVGSDDTPSVSSSSKRQKKPSMDCDRSGFDKLNMLCSATLNLGPLQANPTGCSCPKSKCVALYCDCFKAGRRCDPRACSCVDCKNTIEESGQDGARTKAIQSILARNPRAFTTAGAGNPNAKLPPGEQGCNCVRSRCLKLYCTCFQEAKVCDPGICLCVGCLNTTDDTSGQRQEAIEATLEKRPDAFTEKKRVKEIGSGCACKNNKCIRKYCECFRTNLRCSSKCSCRDCKNP